MMQSEATADLTPAEWEVVEAIAQQLARSRTDVSELRKAIAYLRAYRDRAQAGAKFFEYLRTLVANADQLSRSNQTASHLQQIEQACQQHLASYKEDAATLLRLLGWAARLTQYYQRVS